MVTTLATRCRNKLPTRRKTANNKADDAGMCVCVCVVTVRRLDFCQIDGLAPRVLAK